ncbi:MAG: nucleotidyltransferase family protein [Aigarchaeota archaeon]|nr:nucleotidyltransferase family protein [Aigarchaeota archaeon]
MKGFRGFERGLVPIAGRPMIEYVLDALPDQVSSILIAVDSEEKAGAYKDLAEKYWAEIIISDNFSKSTRRQIDFAISTATTESVLILTCDSPLVTREFTSFLIEASEKFSAVLPRNQARETVYTMAAYQRRPLLEAFAKNPDDEMESLIKKVQKVLYLSSNSLKIFDEKLLMFLRVCNPSDVYRVENILKKRL